MRGIGIALGIAALAGIAGAEQVRPVPALTGPVVDLAGVIPEADERRISALARELRDKTGAEMAVLTVATTAPEDVFGFGMRVAEAWKLGTAQQDNGVLLVVAVDDRKLHLFTGYGLEGILPDGRVGRIRDAYLVPAFRRGDYAGGTYDALRAAAEIIAAEQGVTLTGAPGRRPGPAAPEVPVPLIVGFVLALVLLAILGSTLGPPPGRRRHYHPIFFGGGGFGGGFRGGGGFGGGGGGFGGGGAGGSW
jgi:uncharacterized protein